MDKLIQVYNNNEWAYRLASPGNASFGDDEREDKSSSERESDPSTFQSIGANG